MDFTLQRHVLMAMLLMEFMGGMGQVWMNHTLSAGQYTYPVQLGIIPTALGLG